MVYNIQSTIYTVYCTVYIGHSTRILYNVQCIMYSVQYTVTTIQCTLYTVFCTIYRLLYTTIYIVYYIQYDFIGIHFIYSIASNILSTYYTLYLLIEYFVLLYLLATLFIGVIINRQFDATTPLDHSADARNHSFVNSLTLLQDENNADWIININNRPGYSHILLIYWKVIQYEV